MRDILYCILAILITLAVLAWVMGEKSEKDAQRIYARAHLSEVQNEGRKDLMAGLMPYAVIGVSAIGGTIAIIALTYGLVAVATIWLNRPLPPPPPETRILERQVIIMLQPGQSRRDAWRQLSQATDTKMIENDRRNGP